MTTKKEMQSRIQQLEMLISAETDNTFYPGQSMTELYRSRYDYDRETVLSECLRAWRVNPLARRIVQLYTDFIIGEGLGIRSNHKATHKYLVDWWNHPLNNFNEQIPAWCDELTRAGNLFFIGSVNPMDGMLYIRPLPAEQVKDIITAENDIRQEKLYAPKDISAEAWTAYDKTVLQSSFVLHFAVNRPVGSSWGEPLLAPLLPQLGRYMTWLEDRARINHFRTAYMYVLQGKFATEGERQARELYVNTHKPTPGSILVHNESEKWSIIAAQLDSFDASQDGLNIKKAIAAGAGLPLHYLAEPESSTRTTADAAGTPTFRSLERIQKAFIAMLDQMADIALAYRKIYDRRVSLNSVVEIINPDITERDNSLLALSVSRAYTPLIDLFDRRLIESPELMRMVYRMAGETFDEEKPVPPGIRKPIVQATQPELPMPTASSPSEDDEPKEDETE